MKHEIKIPERLGKRLAHDKTWESRVTQLRARLSEVLDREPYFFPDYTKHGVDHVNRVLALADRLIAADTLSDLPQETDLLTPRDAAFLISAIMLHDAGMFLTLDGMRALVRGHRRTDLVEDLDEEDWAGLWAEYIAKTRRMSDDSRLSQFGRSITASEDCVDKAAPDEDDRRIAGEFLRRHHGRLAHEIALKGMPADEDVDLLEGTGLSEEDRDMLGLLARSHCMEIRETEEYLERFNEGPMPHSLPAFYLMAVLRMADYLDAGEERAPEILLRLQKLRAPASQDEWTWNQCIDFSSIQWDDRKHNVRINAHPAKSSQFVMVDKWLTGVQRELDMCWTILAEQYPGERYRLTIHRILSNIREKAPRARLDKKFLTREVKVTANPEIIKLMMEPLYGDDPTYGVRELLQNAVDACVERKEWEHKHGNPNYKGLVDVRIEGDTFTITDNGMGMNDDILLNHYLCAGSSYRDSEAWKAIHAPDGESQVARTGKFGVGFLAAFLLGDEVEVHTQYWSPEADWKKTAGCHFKFDQRSMPLDVVREKRKNPHATRPGDPTGTTITIKLKEIARKRWEEQPKWYNWYAFDEPEVRYIIDGEEMRHEGVSLHRDPAENPDWFKLATDHYETYLWQPTMSRGSQEFYGNGIRIYGGLPDDLEDYGLDVAFPHISVIDKKSKLDVDLSRRTLKSIPEEYALIRETFRYHIARLLLTPWDTEEEYRQNFTLGFYLHEEDHWGRIPYFLSPGGFTLNHASFVPALSIREYVILFYMGQDARAALRNARSFLGNVPCSISASDIHGIGHAMNYSKGKYYIEDPSLFVSRILQTSHRLFHPLSINYSLSYNVAAVWLREDSWRKITTQGINLSRARYSDGIWTASFEDRHSKMPIRWEQFPIEEFPVAIHVVPDHDHEDFRDCADSLFVQVLKETLVPEPDYPDQDLWIPFDMEERKKKFKTVFKKLAPYIEYIKKHPIE